MRNIEASPWLENPELVEIKAVPTLDKQAPCREFNMNLAAQARRRPRTRQGRGQGAAPSRAAKKG